MRSDKTIIFHNAQCSKSCEALNLLQQVCPEVEIINYLEHPPSIEELTRIIGLLGIKPQDLIRKNEKDYLRHFAEKNLSDEDWIVVMIKHPHLIERPIIIHKKKAVIGRPPSIVLDFLQSL